MIEGRDIVCFSNDWDGDPLSKNHIVLRLATRNRVLWVNSLGNRAPGVSVRDFRRMAKKLREHLRGYREVQHNIYVFSPLAVPFPGSAVAAWINRRYLAWSLGLVCRRLGFREPISYSFLPTSVDVVGSLGESLIIYHCVDEFSQFSGANGSAIAEMERRLMRKSDAVIASSRILFEAKRRYNHNTALVAHGVDVETFRRALDQQTTVPEDIAALPRPRIGFFGLIADWIDLDLVEFLARSRPDCCFVLIGKVEVGVDTSRLRRLPNVHFLGRREYRQLPGYCKGFDLAILPFVINPLTLASNPLKAREYLAAGLPVISTAIPEVERLGNVRIARSYRHFLEEMEGLLATGLSGPQSSIASSMEGESWDAKVEELSQIIKALEPAKPLTPALVA